MKKVTEMVSAHIFLIWIYEILFNLSDVKSIEFQVSYLPNLLELIIFYPKKYASINDQRRILM